MGRRKRRTLELKPFCYYCDRSFEDEKVLLLHQKARHFKCHRCNRKLDTATGLVVHLLQVHKETISRVPNAKKERDSPELVVHGMSGVPPEMIADKQQTLANELKARKQVKNQHTVFGSGMFDQQGGFATMFGFQSQEAGAKMPDISVLSRMLGLAPPPAPAPAPAPVPPAVVAAPTVLGPSVIVPTLLAAEPAPVLALSTGPERVIATAPPGGLLVYDDDLVSPEEHRAARYSYRAPVIIRT